MLILFIAISGSNIYGQDDNQLIIGKVSFVTSRNIYVKFIDTEDIQIGDSLRFMNQIKPCLVVKSKSSSSVVCSIVNDCKVNKGDDVYFGYAKHHNENKEVAEITKTTIDSTDVKNKTEKDLQKQTEKICHM